MRVIYTLVSVYISSGELFFFQKEYETQYGLVYRDGRLAIDNAYQYTFNSAEMKSPVMQIVRDSGWRYKPVIFFTRWLGG